MGIAQRIYDELWGRLDDEPPRLHLGASAIGADCERAVQLGFRLASKKVFGGRMHRLFEAGNAFEPRIIAELRGIGFQVEGMQDRLGDNVLSGSCDGKILIDGSWGILEAKTHNDKSFKAVSKDGVLTSKPQHFSQMQVYMGFAKLGFALYVAENKNTSELYFEVVPFLQEKMGRLYDRALRIHSANELLPEMAGASSTFFKCKWCDSYGVCQQGAIPQKNCRTCSKWTDDVCQGHAIPDEVIPVGCDNHLFHPMFVPWQPLDGASDWIRYDNGVVNCTVTGFPQVSGEAVAIVTSDEMVLSGSFDKLKKVALVRDAFEGEIVDEES